MGAEQLVRVPGSPWYSAWTLTGCRPVTGAGAAREQHLRALPILLVPRGYGPSFPTSQEVWWGLVTWRKGDGTEG